MSNVPRSYARPRQEAAFVTAVGGAQTIADSLAYDGTLSRSRLQLYENDFVAHNHLGKCETQLTADDYNEIALRCARAGVMMDTMFAEYDNATATIVAPLQLHHRTAPPPHAQPLHITFQIRRLGESLNGGAVCDVHGTLRYYRYVANTDGDHMEMVQRYDDIGAVWTHKYRGWLAMWGDTGTAAMLVRTRPTTSYELFANGSSAAQS